MDSCQLLLLKVRVSWELSTEHDQTHLVGYRIRYYTNAEDQQEEDVMDLQKTSTVLTGLLKGRSYFIGVATLSEIKTGRDSAVVEGPSSLVKVELRPQIDSVVGVGYSGSTQVRSYAVFCCVVDVLNCVDVLIGWRCHLCHWERFQDR